MKNGSLFVIGLLVLSLVVCGGVFAQPKGRGFPLSEAEMKPYEGIPFQAENFEKIKRGMSQRQVLQLLGKPLRITKEHRRHNRWTVHYFYPQGHVVNFKDGLVVGKE